MKYLILTLTFLFLLPVATMACVCEPTATVQKAFAGSAAIFTGKFIGSEYRMGIKSEFAEQDNEFRGKKREYEVLVYRFEVAHWYKGDNGTLEAILTTDNVRFLDDGTGSVSNCGLSFKEGESYLIYAYGDKDKINATFCSRTKRLSRAQADLTVLKRLVERGEGPRALQINREMSLSNFWAERTSAYCRQPKFEAIPSYSLFIRQRD